MGILKTNNVKLSNNTLEKLGIAVNPSHNAGSHRTGARNRKEKRREAKTQQKAKQSPWKERPVAEGQNDNAEKYMPVSPADTDQRQAFNLTANRVGSGNSPPTTSAPRPAKRIKTQATREDAEIAALESLLGLTGSKANYQSVGEETLDYVLEGLENPRQVSVNLAKKQGCDVGDGELLGQKSLSRKQKTATGLNDDAHMSGGSGESAVTSKSCKDDTAEVEKRLEANGDGTDGATNVNQPERRENPYKPPGGSSGKQPLMRYVPPSLRNIEANGANDFSSVHKQLKGSINRLSESNILSVVQSVEDLTNRHPRRKVFQALLDILLEYVADPAPLQDTFLLLHAGFIAGLSKRLGPDFAAMAVACLDHESQRYDPSRVRSGSVGKEYTNLMGLMTHLYIFRVVGNHLVYDYIRLCLQNLNEESLEHLLKILRVAGRQLKSDNPLGLKEVVNQISLGVEKIGTNNLSSRTKFMVETIEALQDKRGKTGLAANAVLSEHTISMKKRLGSMNTQELRFTEPLSLTLNDLRSNDRVGQWWLFDRTQNKKFPSLIDPINVDQRLRHGLGISDDPVLAKDRHLVRLAKENHMKTDIRRSIFFAVMSASDCDDACARLRRLRLRRKQEGEISKVLIQCLASEQPYNPFYTVLSQRICCDRQQKMAFQFCLWDTFKRMDRNSEAGDVGTADVDGGLELESVINLARMYGSLIANGYQSLGLLKVLDLAYLRARTKIFVRILLITIMLQTQKEGHHQRDEAALMKPFIQPKEMPEMASTLQYFLRKYLSPADIVSSRDERGLIDWSRSIVDKRLTELMRNNV